MVFGYYNACAFFYDAFFMDPGLSGLDRNRQGLELTSLSSQLVVQLSQLLEEPVVGSDLAMLPDSRQGVHGGHVLTNHEVGQHAGARPAHPHQAVDQNLA